MSRQSLATLAIVVVVAAAANSALAGGCGGGKRYYGGVNLHHRYISSHNQGVYRKTYQRPVVVHKPVVVEKHIVDHCHHPKFCLAYVCPGETLLSICAREYGNPNFWTQVAAFNRIPAGAPLAVGQAIKLPAIFDSGRMIPSTAPAPPAPTIAVPAANVAIPATPAAVAAPAAPIGVAAPATGPVAGPAPQSGIGRVVPQGQPGLPQQQLPQSQPRMQQPSQQTQPQQLPPGQPTSSAPSMSIRQAQRMLPTFTTGSKLVLDGQQFGGTPGQVQLVVGPMTLPVAIANWTPSELTIQLPELPLTKASDARVVILDGAGKLVTQSEIRLAPTSSRLAMGN